jgi:hypothetical protein
MVFTLPTYLKMLDGIFFSSLLANIGNCTLNEGNSHPCKIGNFQLGGLLYQMGVAGWFMLLSLPSGLVGLAWGISLLKERNK